MTKVNEVNASLLFHLKTSTLNLSFIFIDFFFYLKLLKNLDINKQKPQACWNLRISSHALNNAQTTDIGSGTSLLSIYKNAKQT